jgi:hypothetical protein
VKVKFMRFSTFLIITLLLSSTSDLLEAKSGSAYSRFGIGERYHLASVRSIGMGGASVALRGANHFNVANPATWSDFPVVQFSGSLYYQNIQSDDGVQSGGIGSGNLNGAMLGLPVLPSQGITVGIGFMPMSSVGYNIETRTDIEGGYQTTKYSGNGGITNLVAGSSFQLHRNISVGAMALFRVGVLNYEWSNQFSIPGYGTAVTNRELELNGIAGQFGVVYSGLLSPRREGEFGPVTIGAIFTTQTRLKVEEEFNIVYGIGVDTTTVRNGYIELPYSFGFGISLRIDQRNIFAADARYEPWENFRRFGNPDSHLRNATRVGFGWERLGRYDEIGASFIERTTFRLGFLYNASYFNIRNQPINETFVTFGLGIPLSGVAVLDIGSQIGIRGTTNNNLQRDTVFRLFFSLSLFERWFVPPIIE